MPFSGGRPARTELRIRSTSSAREMSARAIATRAPPRSISAIACRASSDRALRRKPASRLKTEGPEAARDEVCRVGIEGLPALHHVAARVDEDDLADVLRLRHEAECARRFVEGKLAPRQRLQRAV